MIQGAGRCQPKQAVRRRTGCECGPQLGLAVDRTLEDCRPIPHSSNVGSNERSGLPLRGRPQAKPVDVSLDALFPSDHPAAIEGLKLHGWAAGALHRWLRSTDGQWIGVVTILIERSDGSIFKAVEQLVPASAMRRR